MNRTAPLFAGLAALTLPSCSGGADGVLQPGMYEMSMGGGIAGITVPGVVKSSGGLPERICLSGDPEHYPARLMRPYMRIHDGCGEAKIERDGAKLSGVAICPLDQDRAAGGTITMLLSGEIAGDSVEGEISTKWDLGAVTDPELIGAAKLMQSATLRVSAKYIGACDGSSVPPPRKKSSGYSSSGSYSSTDAMDNSVAESAPIDTSASEAGPAE